MAADDWKQLAAACALDPVQLDSAVDMPSDVLALDEADQLLQIGERVFTLTTIAHEAVLATNGMQVLAARDDVQPALVVDQSPRWVGGHEGGRSGRHLGPKGGPERPASQRDPPASQRDPRFAARPGFYQDSYVK